MLVLKQYVRTVHVIRIILLHLNEFTELSLPKSLEQLFVKGAHHYYQQIWYHANPQLIKVFRIKKFAVINERGEAKLVCGYQLPG